MPIRISVTDIDSYLYWKDSEDMSLDELIARLKGQQEPTVQMLAGRAFHKLFETAKIESIDKAEIDGFKFSFFLDQEIALPAVRELKGERIFNTPSGPVTLVGKVDALSGVIHDYKLTERFDIERYTDSYQWRAYLAMFSAKTFVYDVFLGRYDENHISVYDYHCVRFNAYPRMLEDVQREVSELAEIVAKYVPEKVHSERSAA